ncbi:hypothetical protein [Embleya sp. NBC_00896]|uniref:hypothetical protein n=1 Tax=Embleya sp. NBC_00896 TaxID=2975961 RepID=UPI003863923C|nr:hypothetical protein OG928_26350 [Embleya sp. NBC_00896]
MKWWHEPQQRLGVICAAVAVLVIVGLINKASGDDTKSAAAEGTPTAQPNPPAVPSAPAAKVGGATTTPPAKPSQVPKNVLPDVVGADLQKAWDGARAAGYRFVTSHDASGRGRRQFLYSSWKVCDQKPAAGPLAKELPVELGVVRHDEKCPGAVPTTEPKVVGGRMPAVVGRSVNIVRAALRGDAHVKATDLGGNRAVFIETHWMVCTQQPAAGEPLSATVEVGVVKYGEPCP